MSSKKTESLLTNHNRQPNGDAKPSTKSPSIETKKQLLSDSHFPDICLTTNRDNLDCYKSVVAVKNEEILNCALDCNNETIDATAGIHIQMNHAADGLHDKVKVNRLNIDVVQPP